MKRLFLCAVFCAIAALLFGCQKTEVQGVEPDLRIVATIFPQYDWLRELTRGREGLELTLLLDKGVDLHSYQPTADDLIKVSRADIFVYTGGHSDSWVEPALDKVSNKNQKSVSLLALLGDKAKKEEEVEGMEHHHHDHDDEADHDHEHEADHDHEHEADHDHEHEHEHEEEWDEHVWLSLKNAVSFCEALRDVLCQKDPENKELYKKNCSEYVAKLKALDEAYAEAVSQASEKTLLFGDRFPFLYLVKDYGLSYYAAFSGCSAESEASFETVVFLAKKTDELSLKAILCLESSDGSLAETIKQSTAKKDQTILKMDSMQSTSAKSVAAGQTYLGTMEYNLTVLKDALK